MLIYLYYKLDHNCKTKVWTTVKVIDLKWFINVSCTCKIILNNLKYLCNSKYNKVHKWTCHRNTTWKHNRKFPDSGESLASSTNTNTMLFVLVENFEKTALVCVCFSFRLMHQLLDEKRQRKENGHQNKTAFYFGPKNIYWALVSGPVIMN